MTERKTKPITNSHALQEKQIPREFKANQRPSLIRKFHYRTAITYTLTQRERERERETGFFFK